MVSTLAGSGDWAFADGLGTVAKFRGPLGLWVAYNGDVWVADTYNNRIRVIISSGVYRLRLFLSCFANADNKITAKLMDRVCEYLRWLWYRWLC